jgi:hypothetical protein
MCAAATLLGAARVRNAEKSNGAQSSESSAHLLSKLKSFETGNSFTEVEFP